MKLQLVRNKDYYSRDTHCRGECPKFMESATLSIHLSGNKENKFDLQPTFSPRVKECSLLKEKSDRNTSCMLSCPLFEAYRNSHDY